MKKRKARREPPKQQHCSTGCKQPKRMYKYKLDLKLHGAEEDFDGGVKIWYKDQGGQEKNLSLKVRVLDQDGNLHLYDKEIALQFTLFYEDRLKVAQQDLLRISPCSDRSIYKNGTGESTVRYRISEVSRNHQKKSFCVHISPANENGEPFDDIEPVYSEPVIVKSKKSGTRSIAQSPCSQEGAPTESFYPSHGSELERKPTDAIVDWTNSTIKILADVEWMHYGYEPNSDGGFDLDKPVFRCPSCKVFKTCYQDATHELHCPLVKCLREYSEVVGQLESLSAGHCHEAVPETPPPSTISFVKSEPYCVETGGVHATFPFE